ncbi:hypothetical protein HK099_000240 [Clydaea vesicula]|uniref:Uncharacterized protein n=1 Tax=Clydaea vesicula TaxID=447962 RepID=A0AAD5TVJ1_9FUNG|nr:hypothetical protein HK099_000240 [Clydaea vesicula]
MENKTDLPSYKERLSTVNSFNEFNEDSVSPEKILIDDTLDDHIFGNDKRDTVDSFDNPELSRLAGIYTTWLTPSLFPFFAFECMKRYLQCQGIMHGNLFVLTLAAPFCFFLQWLLVWKFSLGFIGSSIGLTISYCLLPILLLIYIYFFTSCESWGGFDSSEAFNLRLILQFLKLGFSGVASGWIGEAELAAQSIVLSSCVCLELISLGIAIGATTRWLWTNEQSVVSIVASIMPVAAIFQFCDGFNVVGAGILRGCGHQDVGALLNIVAFYVVGVPVAMLTAFKLNWGLFGLWAGLGSGLVIVSIFQIYWILKIDWKLEAQKAQYGECNESSIETI